VPGLVDVLIQHGEAGVRWAFQTRDILKQVAPGERLDRFIAEFVKMGRKPPVPIPSAPPNVPPA
jgi:hypothetical protein